MLCGDGFAEGVCGELNWRIGGHLASRLGGVTTVVAGKPERAKVSDVSSTEPIMP